MPETTPAPTTPTTPRQLDQLIAENQLSNPAAKRVARSTPRDHEATTSLRKDNARMQALADLAKVDRDKIIDAAIRGNKVTFVVVDDDGAPSDGMFEVSDLPDPSGPDEVSTLREQVAALEQRLAAGDAPRSEPDQKDLAADDADLVAPPDPPAARGARAPRGVGKPKPADTPPT